MNISSEELSVKCQLKPKSKELEILVIQNENMDEKEVGHFDCVELLSELPHGTYPACVSSQQLKSSDLKNNKRWDLKT